MKTTSDVKDVREAGRRMVSILELASAPVGVRLVKEEHPSPEPVEPLKKHRYCQALMKARHGQRVILDGTGISCPAAAAAFGFRPLPAKLQSGDGLVGFGIVSDKAVGEEMFAGMPRLAPGELRHLLLFPLDKASCVPDVVVVEDEVEKLMWIVLSALHATGGKRVGSSTAVLQATCVDATIVPYLEDRLNFSYGCYGCRDATDIGSHETILGFPGASLPAIAEHLEFLSKEAIPVSRAKRAWRALEQSASKERNQAT